MNWNPNETVDRALVKPRLASTRDLRNALLQTLHFVMEERGPYQLILVEPRVRFDLIEHEVSRLKEALRPEVAKYLLVFVGQGERWEAVAQNEHIENVSMAALNHFYHRPKDTAPSPATIKLGRPDLQSEVFRVLLNGWVHGRGPYASVELEQMVGCSYRTVAAALKSLGPLVGRLTDRRVYLKRFPERAWASFTAAASQSRSSLYFVDRSGQPRSAESLIRRLEKQGLKDVGVGGVFGAKTYYPALDLVGSPRLDLCVHAPDGHADVSFVERLDPGLVRTEDEHEPARLVLHVLRRKESLFDRDEDGGTFADPIECLADLTEARLMQQAEAFGAFLQRRGKELSGNK